MAGLCELFHKDPGEILTWDPARLALAIRVRDHRLALVAQAKQTGAAPMPVIVWAGLS